MGPSTHSLAALPNAGKLEKLCQSLAILDAILSPEWGSRYYSFNSHWAEKTALASMRDGSGDDYFILFLPAGVVIKGFAHEAAMSPYRVQPPSVWPGVLDALPEALRVPLSNPALSMDDVTFCLWNTVQDQKWVRGDIEFPDAPFYDGSEDLLGVLDGNPETYRRYAAEYYERELSLGAIDTIYKHQPLTKSGLKRLNPEVTLKDLAEDIAEIGYPTTLR